MTFEFFITALVVVLIPGTGVVYTVATGLGRGRAASAAAAFGCTLGIVPHILASVLGLAAILHTSAIVFQAFKYAGAAYLMYLAWQTLRSKGPLVFKPAMETKTLVATIRTGLLINILNPKLSIFFLAFLPQFVVLDTPSTIVDMLGLGGIFMLMTFVVFVIYGQFAALVRECVLESAVIMAWLRRLTAAIFGILGMRLAISHE